MFAPKTQIEVLLRVSMSVMILFNALAPTAAYALGGSDVDTQKATDVEASASDSIVEPKPLYFDPPESPKLQESSPEPDEPISPVPPKDPIEFTLVADPAIVPADGLITFNVYVRNNTEQEIPALTYTDLLETGVQYSQNSSSPVTFDTMTNQVSLVIASLAIGEEFLFSYTLSVTSLKRSQIDEKLRLHSAELKSADDSIHLKTSAAIAVDLPAVEAVTEIVPMQPDGGWNALEQVEVYMDKDAVGENVVVMASPIAGSESGPELQFSLEVFETTPLATDSSGELNEQMVALQTEYEEVFKEPAFLEINLDGYVDLNNIPAGQEPYVATYDELHEIWVKVPILETDSATNSVTVEASHFSTWGAGLGSTLPQNGANVLLFDQPYTSLFTGAARYSIPIWTPPGRAGMQPDLSLSYSSSTVDGVLGDVQAPWVGVGWNMDSVEIVRKITTDEDGYGYENNFALTINGTKYDLLVDTDDLDQSHYYTKQSSFLQIERHNFALDNNPSTENKTGEWWEVTTSDGTSYRLGWYEESEQLALMYGYTCSSGNPCKTPDGAYASSGYAGTTENLVAMRWRVDKVQDLYGNYMTYTYKEEYPESPLVPHFDRASYLQSIVYTQHSILDDLKKPYYHVEFDYGIRSGDVPTEFNIWDNFDNQQLNSIRICYDICDDNNFVRKYQFGYSLAEVPNENGTLTLTSLQIVSGNFSVEGVSSANLTSPRIKFTYEDKPNRADLATGHQELFEYPRLTRIENGYGGSLNYTYDDDKRGPTSWYNYGVKTVNVLSGVDTVAIRGYTYVTPVYTGANNTKELIGYTKVHETTYDFDGTTKLSETTHQFGTEGLDTGFELVTEAKDPSGTVLQKSTSVYVTDNSAAPFQGWNYRYLYESANYVRSGTSLVLTSKTVYTRNPSTGNLTLRQDYIGNTLYRKQYYEYVISPDKQEPPASDVHILDRVSHELLVDAGNIPVSETRYIYDNGAEYLTKGELTVAQRLLDATNTSDTRYVYDNQYGNVLKTCVSKGYGTLNTIPTGGLCTEVVYDSDMYMYPLESKNTMGQVSSSSYIYQLGLPYQTTDLNGWTTTTSYDRFGRALSVTPPGFPADKVGVRYTYPPVVDDQVAAPYNVKMEMWDEIASTYRPVWGIYDGMGRMLQTQTLDTDRDQVLVSESQYNALGLVSRQSLPFYAGYSNDEGITLSSGASQFTETSYDALGRAIQVTSPGSITAYTQYNGLITTSIDPNGNKVARTTDGLGRMKYVQEYNGDVLYATTSFAYDVADRLKTTTDAQNNVTTLTYDHLGRKVIMDDPDMGHWTYEYDALGSLTQQTDARDCKLLFEYDNMGRLKTKSSQGADCGPAANTQFFYDSDRPETTQYDPIATDQFGFRTLMIDQSGSTAWNYENVGRVVTETKTIGVGTAAKQSVTTADWLGRVWTVVYPDETIEYKYDYDALGRAKSLSNGSITFATLGYNTLSQIASVDLANGVRTENEYASDTHRLKNRHAFLGASTFMDFGYLYDQAGNITQLTDQVLNETVTYDYDFLNRLTFAEAEDISPTGEGDYSYRQSFEYDKVGNILSRREWDDADLVYANDFEGELVTDWSQVVSDPEEIWTITSDGFPPASGTRSVVFDINDNTSLFLADTTPGLGGDEPSYRARFYVHPNHLSMGDDDVLDLFAGFRADGTQVLRIQMQKVAADYQIRVGILNDSGTWLDSPWQIISNQWTALEINYLSAPSKGSLELWINGVSKQKISLVDNDTSPINKVQLGATAIETTTRGQILFDAFESRRSTYIGTVPGQSAKSTDLIPVAYRLPASDGQPSVLMPPYQSGFPTTSVLDNFDRANGSIGSNWSGFPSAFSIVSNQLDVTAAGWDTYAIWSSNSFGADQEAFITFTQLHTNSGNEHSLVLKSQSSTSNTGLIYVCYDASGQNVQVWTYHPSQDWVQRGTSISATFTSGDQLGARA